MSKNTKGGKRGLSHDRADELSNPKRGRVIAATESPGGTTLREKSPPRLHRTCAQPISASAKTMSSQAYGSSSSSSARSQLQDELSRLTIKEKLHKGITMSFARERKYGNDVIQGIGSHPLIPCNELQYLRHGLFTVKGMQKIAEFTSHVDACFDPILLETPENRAARLFQQGLNVPMWTLGLRGPQILGTWRNQHMRWRHLISLRESNQRLQSITGVVNSNPFMPFHPGLKVQSAEKPHSARPLPEGNRSLSPPENLLAFLEHSARKNGYRKLGLDSLVFKELLQPHMLDLDDIEIPPIGSMSEIGPIEVDEAEMLVSLDAKKGSITLYQTNL